MCRATHPGALLSGLVLLHSLLVAALFGSAAYVALLAALLGVWRHVRRARRGNWEVLRLKYEEAPEPVVRGLNLLR